MSAPPRRTIAAISRRALSRRFGMMEESNLFAGSGERASTTIFGIGRPRGRLSRVLNRGIWCAMAAVAGPHPPACSACPQAAVHPIKSFRKISPSPRARRRTNSSRLWGSAREGLVASTAQRLLGSGRISSAPRISVVSGSGRPRAGSLQLHLHNERLGWSVLEGCEHSNIELEVLV